MKTDTFKAAGKRISDKTRRAFAHGSVIVGFTFSVSSARVGQHTRVNALPVDASIRLGAVVVSFASCLD